MNLKVKFEEQEQRFRADFGELHVISGDTTEISDKFRSIAQGDSFTLTADDLTGIDRIHDYAFYRTHITDLKIPKGINSIGNGSFEACTLLAHVTFSEGLQTIGTSSFMNCGALVLVTFPKSLTTLGDHSFNGTTLQNVVIPSSAITVGYGVFNRCINLETVIFQGNVQSIGGYAFKGCRSLKLIDFTACTSVPPLVRSDVFDGVPSTCEVRVPPSLYDAWITATNWSACADLIIPY